MRIWNSCSDVNDTARSWPRGVIRTTESRSSGLNITAHCRHLPKFSFFAEFYKKKHVFQTFSCPCCHALVILSSLFCPGWPVRPVSHFLSRLPCPRCLASAHLCPLSCPCCKVLVDLTWLTMGKNQCSCGSELTNIRVRKGDSSIKFSD